VSIGEISLQCLLPFLTAEYEWLHFHSFHVASWLEKHHPVAADDLLPTAGGSGPAKVTVELVEGGDDEARRKKEEEADAKRSVWLI
jgi:hypothetical protein